jgi:hypothetical protein
VWLIGLIDAGRQHHTPSALQSTDTFEVNKPLSVNTGDLQKRLLVIQSGRHLVDALLHCCQSVEKRLPGETQGVSPSSGSSNRRQIR